MKKIGNKELMVIAVVLIVVTIIVGLVFAPRTELPYGLEFGMTLEEIEDLPVLGWSNIEYIGGTYMFSELLIYEDYFMGAMTTLTFDSEGGLEEFMIVSPQTLSKVSEGVWTFDLGVTILSGIMGDPDRYDYAIWDFSNSKNYTQAELDSMLNSGDAMLCADWAFNDFEVVGRLSSSNYGNVLYFNFVQK